MTRERIDLTGGDGCIVSGAARKDSSSRTINLVNHQKNPDPGIDVDIFQDDALQNHSLQDEDARFLRTEKRVSVRRGPLPKKTAGRLKIWGTLALAFIVAGGLGGVAYRYGTHISIFTLASSDNIEITGVRNASRTEVMKAYGEDIGRSVFFVPLDQRRIKIETLAWVESATVMRLFPDRIAVHVVERTPVAFVQTGSRIQLIDAAGVILELPANRQAKYSFPVIHGIAETESLSARGAAMKIYNGLVHDLDSGNYTRQLSEVDLSDPDDIKATVDDADGTVLIHLGATDFLERYKLFAERRQQFAKVQSVDMRYEGQIVANQEPEKPAERAKNSGDPLPASAGRAIARPPGYPNKSKSGDRKPASAQQSRKPQKKAVHQDSKTKKQKPRAKSQ